MAGGGEGLGGGPKQKRGGNGKRKAKKRVGFRLDMTPLVDITFLLLTFFMLTTSMITPQTMEMNVPPELDIEIEVRESELLIIRVRADGKLFVNMGNEEPEAAVSMKELHKFVVDKNIDLENRAIVTLKADGESPYGLVVQILDELNACEPEIIQGLQRNGIDERKRKFTVAPYTEDDIKIVGGL